MTKILFALTCTVIFALTMSANTGMGDSASKDGTTRAMTNTKYQDSSNDESTNNVDMEMIMNECNETFRIEMAYLESLNQSGSFVDETDRTPKCYMRCVLERSGVLSPDDAMFNPARAAMIFAGERNGKLMEDIGDITALCATNRNESCRCEKAYMFMRCLMTMEIEKYETSQT